MKLTSFPQIPTLKPCNRNSCIIFTCSLVNQVCRSHSLASISTCAPITFCIESSLQYAFSLLLHLVPTENAAFYLTSTFIMTSKKKPFSSSAVDMNFIFVSRIIWPAISLLPFEALIMCMRRRPFFRGCLPVFSSLSTEAWWWQPFRIKKC